MARWRRREEPGAGGHRWLTGITGVRDDVTVQSGGGRRGVGDRRSVCVCGAGSRRGHCPVRG